MLDNINKNMPSEMLSGNNDDENFRHIEDEIFEKLGMEAPEAGEGKSVNGNYSNADGFLPLKQMIARGLNC